MRRRPKLRALEAIVVQDASYGQAIRLRDTEGVASGAVVVPARWSAVLARFDGTRSIEEIAADASRATGRAVDARAVEELAEQLERACMLDGPRLWARRRDVTLEFNAAEVRPAAHAGGAYPGEQGALAAFIEQECLVVARRGAAPETQPARRMLGVCAPHMDLWRAAAGYGHAYAALSRALSAPGGEAVDTFVLLGTSHAHMRRPFAVCDKAFDTPLGALPPDRDLVVELAAESRFDVREEQYLHKIEHSIEFQAVFLKHLLGGRQATIVPVLCGLSACQATGRDPALDDQAESFLRALGASIARRRDRVMIIAGADLAHVGPRFGDPAPLDVSQRSALRGRDRSSIARALRLDAPGFFKDVASDLDTRRVCGLGPIYTLLRALPVEARGEELNYDQCVDPEEGSIVSHASMGFYAGINPA